MATGDPHNFGYGGCWCGINHFDATWYDAFTAGRKSAGIPIMNVDYDEEYGWLIENDGYGCSRIIASDVSPEDGRRLVEALTGRRTE
jgi:hypothetical protein